MNIADKKVLNRIEKKLSEYDMQELSEAELLALLLGEGDVLRDAHALAGVLLEKFGSLPELFAQDERTLRECALHLDSGCARRIALTNEISRRLRRKPRLGRVIYTGDDAYELLSDEMSGLPQEQMRVLLLDNNHAVISIEIISLGTLTSTGAHPRDVFRAAVCKNAQAVLLVHNHPSGKAEPSPTDDTITESLKKVGSLLGIPVLDHIIIGAECFYTYTERRLVKRALTW